MLGLFRSIDNGIANVGLGDAARPKPSNARQPARLVRPIPGKGTRRRTRPGRHAAARFRASFGLHSDRSGTASSTTALMLIGDAAKSG